MVKKPLSEDRSVASTPRESRRRSVYAFDASTTWSRVFIRLLNETNSTQRQVCRETGLDKNTVSALVHGRDFKVSTAIRLAEYFQVGIWEFFLPENLVVQNLSGPNSQKIRRLLAQLNEIIAADDDPKPQVRPTSQQRRYARAS